MTVLEGIRCVGIDVGSTYIKVLAVEFTDDCRADAATVIAEGRLPTPWRDVAGGGSEMDADELAGRVHSTLGKVVAAAGGQIAGIGVSGMAESGVLLDDAGRPQAPLMAWFDPRGQHEMEAAPASFRHDFPATTGLPVSPLATIAKLLYLRDHGRRLDGLTWLNVPEYVAHVLGGDRTAEPSLAARTGMIDQDSGTTWPAAVEILECDPMPPARTAGSVWGRHRDTGAALTVAGHDHLVASIAAGVLDPGDLYDSIGTAEALIRPLTEPIPGADRRRLACAGINVTRHLLPGRSVMLAGAKTGLMLRRVLHLLGIEDGPARDLLDDLVLRLPQRGESPVQVSGADIGDGVLHVRIEADEVSPEVLFAATLRHTTDEVTRLLDLMATCTPPPRRSVVSGGWSQMACVREARRSVLPHTTFSARTEDTAFGAALIALYAAIAHSGSPTTTPQLVEFIRDVHQNRQRS